MEMFISNCLCSPLLSGKYFGMFTNDHSKLRSSEVENVENNFFPGEKCASKVHLSSLNISNKGFLNATRMFRVPFCQLLTLDELPSLCLVSSLDRIFLWSPKSSPIFPEAKYNLSTTFMHVIKVYQFFMTFIQFLFMLLLYLLLKKRWQHLLGTLSQKTKM